MAYRDDLEQQLAQARADVAEAREEGLAHEMIAHSVAQQQLGLGEAPARSEVDERVARARPPTSGEAESRQQRVRVWRGHHQQLRVSFE